MTDLEKAAQTIQEGGLVAFPTETVYGLGADALNPLAVARVFEAKGRPTFDPLIVHVGDLGQAEVLVEAFPKPALALAEKFWPGPLTLVLPKRSLVPDLVTASLPSVAVRVPRHPLAQELIRQSGRPIAAPSANPFGQVSPTTAQHVKKYLGGKVDLILDGGPCEVGVESAVVSFLGENPVLLRPGGIGLEELEAVIGKIGVFDGNGGTGLSPGRLPQHYAPRTPLKFGDIPGGKPSGKTGLLCLQRPKDTSGFNVVEVLSEKGDLREAAARLFAALHRLDEKGLDLILALPLPEEGLGSAINDRLQRAGASFKS